MRLLRYAVLALLVMTAGNLYGQKTELPPAPGHYTIPDASLPFIPGYAPFRIGAMGSGIFYAGGNEFWGITDRGPNVDSGSTTKIFVAPNFQTLLYKMRVMPNGIVRLIDSMYLTRPGGGRTSGLPAPALYGAPETARDTFFNALGTDPWGFDSEGLARAADGSFWLSEEYGASIAHLSRSGEVIERIWPSPTDGLPDVLKKRRSNRGFEGVAITPNGKIYAIVQSGMTNSYSGKTKDDENASEKTELIRFVEYDPNTRTSRMFAYLMDAGYPESGGSGMRRRDVKMGDLVALNNNEFLVLEHGERGSQSPKLIYKISIADATPITTEVFETSPGTFKTLEELTRAQLTSLAGLVPVAKTLVLDLRNAGNGNPSYPAGQDKPEGLSVIDPLTIVVSTDNDFGVVSPNADGKVVQSGKQTDFLVYALKSPLDYQVGPTAEFKGDGVTLSQGAQLFQKEFQCAGSTVTTIPFTITNTSGAELLVKGIDIYRTDTVYGQGVPVYPLLRNAGGLPLPSRDYIVTADPAVAPFTRNRPVDQPFTVEAGKTRTLYINFIPQYPGKRFARLVVRTDGINFVSVDTNATHSVYGDVTPRYGVQTVDLFGRGIGASLSDIAEKGHLPKPVVFKPTAVGDSVCTTVTLYNPGACDLRIDRKQFRLAGGDVGEFNIAEIFSDNPVDQFSDTYIIPAGDSGRVTLCFKPSRSGSRRATILLQTSDSTIHLPGLTERGAYYWDVFGTGRIGLEATVTGFVPSIIDGSIPGKGTASIDNSSRELIRIDSLRIVGPDASEFRMDPAKPWPAVPFAFRPGERLEFAVVHSAAPGSLPGARRADLLLFASTGDTIFIHLKGEAGTRTLTLNPTSLFANTRMPVGKSAFEVLMITNNGTLPLQLGATTITGPNAGNYMLGALPRLVLLPGQTEYLEVTFRPVDRGASTATLTVNGNGTNGPQSVTLGGTGMKIGAPANINATSAVEETVGSNGDRLEQSIPNPARDQAVIGYELRRGEKIRLTIYDAAGTEVAVAVDGYRDAGRHQATVDLSALAAGVYNYRLVVGNEILTRTLVVVR